MVLVESFPFIGEPFFEIYFVRLIGTPNQNSKVRYACESNLTRSVVHESLGFRTLFSESLILAQNERWRRG